jgi:hypothetical protein
MHKPPSWREISISPLIETQILTNYTKLASQSHQGEECHKEILKFFKEKRLKIPWWTMVVVVVVVDPFIPCWILDRWLLIHHLLLLTTKS